MPGDSVKYGHVACAELTGAGPTSSLTSAGGTIDEEIIVSSAFLRKRKAKELSVIRNKSNCTKQKIYGIINLTHMFLGYYIFLNTCKFQIKDNEIHCWVVWDTLGKNMQILT